jgi:hypothetical protein
MPSLFHGKFSQVNEALSTRLKQGDQDIQKTIDEVSSKVDKWIHGAMKEACRTFSDQGC